MVENWLEPQDARYFKVRQELEAFLKAKYAYTAHSNYEFKIVVGVLDPNCSVERLTLISSTRMTDGDLKRRTRLPRYVLKASNKSY